MGSEMCIRDRLRIEIERLTVDVDEVDRRAAVHGAIGTRDERDGARPDLVALSDTQREARQVERRRRTVGRDSLGCTANSCDRDLELTNDRPLRQVLGS